MIVLKRSTTKWLLSRLESKFLHIFINSDMLEQSTLEVIDQLDLYKLEEYML